MIGLSISNSGIESVVVRMLLAVVEPSPNAYAGLRDLGLVFDVLCGVVDKWEWLCRSFPFNLRFSSELAGLRGA